MKRTVYYIFHVAIAQYTINSNDLDDQEWIERFYSLIVYLFVFMSKTLYSSAPSTSLASCVRLQCGDFNAVDSMSVNLIKEPDCSVVNIDSSELLDSSFITIASGAIIDLTFDDDEAGNSVANTSLTSFDRTEFRSASLLEIKYTSRLKTRYINESVTDFDHLASSYNCDV